MVKNKNWIQIKSVLKKSDVMVKLLNLFLHGTVMRQQKGTKAKIVLTECHTKDHERM